MLRPETLLSPGLLPVHQVYIWQIQWYGRARKEEPRLPSIFDLSFLWRVS